MFVEDRDIELAEQEQELPPEIEEKKRRGALRTGYTTGTTAAAATKGALCALIDRPVEQATVSLPKGETATLKIAWTKIDGNKVTCAAIKHGGDDPDATHDAEICSTVSFSKNVGLISIDGGKGVGRVTKPGLGLEMGKLARPRLDQKVLDEERVPGKFGDDPHGQAMGRIGAAVKVLHIEFAPLGV